MQRSSLSEPLSGSHPETAARAFDPLNAIRLLRSAGGALYGQAELYGQLACVEWAEEKRRLTKMIATTLIGAIFLSCTLIFFGLLVIALSWDTAYRIPALLTLMVGYGGGIAICWQKLQTLSALGSQSFSATRQEMAADLALIKSKL